LTNAVDQAVRDSLSVSISKAPTPRFELDGHHRDQERTGDFQLKQMLKSEVEDCEAGHRILHASGEDPVSILPRQALVLLNRAFDPKRQEGLAFAQGLETQGQAQIQGDKVRVTGKNAMIFRKPIAFLPRPRSTCLCNSTIFATSHALRATFNGVETTPT